MQTGSIDTPPAPPDVLDINTGKLSPLNLPNLHDPDLPESKPLVPQQITVSPSGKKIAFCAYRWSGNPDEAALELIYTCFMNGTSLKRITPSEISLLEAFKYPKMGVTGLNAWEQFQPLNNTGINIKYGDFAARDKYTQELRRASAAKPGKCCE